MPDEPELMGAWNLFSWYYCTTSIWLSCRQVQRPHCCLWRVTVIERLQHTMMTLLWSTVVRSLMRVNPVNLPSSQDRFLIYRLLKMEHCQVRHISISVRCHCLSVTVWDTRYRPRRHAATLSAETLSNRHICCELPVELDPG